MSDWKDMIVGARMIVDEEFSSRVDASGFSRQEWGLVMTAAHIEFRDADDPEAARLVADTSDLPTVMPELESVADLGAMGHPGGRRQSGGGLVDSLLDTLGLGDDADDDVDPERLEDAERLVAEYAEQLQTHLEREGRWSDVRTAAADETNQR